MIKLPRFGDKIISDDDWAYYLHFKDVHEYIENAKDLLKSSDNNGRIDLLLKSYIDPYLGIGSQMHLNEGTIVFQSQCYNKCAEEERFHNITNQQDNSFMGLSKECCVKLSKTRKGGIVYTRTSASKGTSKSEATPISHSKINISTIQINRKIYLMNFAINCCAIDGPNNIISSWLQNFYLGIASAFMCDDSSILTDYIMDYSYSIGFDGVACYSSHAGALENQYRNYLILMRGGDPTISPISSEIAFSI